MSELAKTTTVTVNGHTYSLPQQPVVIVCVDGCEPDYLTQVVASGQPPWLKKTLKQGTELALQASGYNTENYD